MATLTLAEWAIQQKEPLKKGAALGIAMEGVISDIMTWRSTNSLSETGVRYDEVIEPDWVALDASISSKTAKGKQLAWGIYEMAVHIDVPVALERAGDVIDTPSVRQMMLATKGAAYKVNDQFVNGDQASDPNGFNGIEKIIANLASAQTVLPSAQVDISGAPSDAVVNNFIDLLDEAIDAVEGHKPTFALCNRNVALRARSAIRRAGLLGDHHDWVRDGFPLEDIRRTVATASTKPSFVYQGIPFYDIGVKTDQSTLIIPNTFSDGGLGSTDNTHIYFVKMGEDQVEGLQFSPLETLRIGLLEDKNNERHRLVWRLGLAVWGPRSLSLAGGIKVA